MKASIPFINLGVRDRDLREEIEAAISDVIEQSAFVGGPAVESFEEAFAKYCEASSCVGVANGTEAIELALKALGVGPGDEVLTTPNTFIATTEAIIATGAWPVLVDIDPTTGLLDPSLLAAAYGPRTRAVVPVHVYGTPVDMDAVSLFARSRELVVVEDAAQAHGARWRGRRVGALSDAACYSFYPTKNLGAFGDAGAVVCSDASLASKVRQLSNHGRSGHFEHVAVGRNSRLDAIQAVVLDARLGKLEEQNARRRALAEIYLKGLMEVASDLVVPVVAPEHAEPVYHVFVIRVIEGRDDLAAFLERRGIQTGVHYRLPIHRQPAYRDLLPPGGLERADAWCTEVLSLPLYPEMIESQVDIVCRAVADWARGR